MGKCRLCKQEGHNRKKCPTTMMKIPALELDLETGEITPCDMFRTVDTIQHVEEEVLPTVRDASSILVGRLMSGSCMMLLCRQSMRRSGRSAAVVLLWMRKGGVLPDTIAIVNWCGVHAFCTVMPIGSFYGIFAEGILYRN